MAAFLIEHNVRYIAKSTDIVDDKISGVSVIGALVYTTNDGKWYIVDSDLTLEPYVQPMLESA